jgi:LPXTG-motif cell wall-anchored protein
MIKGIALLAAALFGLLAPAASAHVTVIPAAARPGETRALTFRVLNERDDAKTVRVDLFLPAGVRAKAADRRGWTRVDKPGEIDWIAGADAAIGGAGAKDFELRVGPLPKSGRVVFKVLQHYSDGQIVRWIQDPDPGADRPAPFVQLTASGRPATSGGSSAAGFAILAALLALAAGAGALLLRRRRR